MILVALGFELLTELLHDTFQSTNLNGVVVTFLFQIEDFLFVGLL